MPAHDWTRVKAGIFYHQHTRWIAAIVDALNAGLLPAEFYALMEQAAGEVVPDVLTLHADDTVPRGTTSRPEGVLAVRETPPQVAFVAEGDEIDEFARRQRSVVIRHAGGDDVVALVEIVSRGNKQARPMLERFVDKVVGALFQGVHSLVLDLFPPARHDPDVIHGAIWQQISGTPFQMPPDKRLTLAAYAATVLPTAYVEPIAVNDALPDMPLFLRDDLYINVPLERTYIEAYTSVPDRWRRVIEG